MLIKITYVCELSVKDEKFVFELPTNIAPWNAKQALAETTQVMDDVEICALRDVRKHVILNILLIKNLLINI